MVAVFLWQLCLGYRRIWALRCVEETEAVGISEQRRRWPNLLFRSGRMPLWVESRGREWHGADTATPPTWFCEGVARPPEGRGRSGCRRLMNAFAGIATGASLGFLRQRAKGREVLHESRHILCLAAKRRPHGPRCRGLDPPHGVVVSKQCLRVRQHMGACASRLRVNAWEVYLTASRAKARMIESAALALKGWAQIES